MKNNNPGNIEKNLDVWQGAVYPGNDPRFVTFVSPDYGYRALYKELLTDIKQGVNTLERLISEWAPPSDNNPTEAYINFVAINSGLSRRAVIPYGASTELFNIGYNIARFETGETPDRQQIETGYNMAVGNIPTPINTPGLSGGMQLALGITSIWVLSKLL